MIERLGQQFGNYRLRRLLGRGGFAEVYLGEHIYLQTQAAIKVLHLRLAQSELKDFLQEARTVAHLEHPHIVKVLDFGLEGSIPFLVMNYAPNGSLRQRHPRGTVLPLASSAAYIKEIAAALQYAHEKMLVHRDIKPENMLLGRDNDLLLSDFGVAVVTQSSLHMRREEVGGTAAYMAPEQINGESCPASDQYALGIVAYEWLCGSRPFSGSTEEIVQQHMHVAPQPPRELVPTILPSVEQVVLMALAKAPEQRFACVQDFASAFEQACQMGEVRQTRFTEPAPSLTTQPLIEQTPSATSAPSLHTPYWNIPYRRNPYFTGREEILQSLYTRLRETQGKQEATWTQALAISGLGGIGKTQTAVEYAYRYHADYQAVLWVKADTYETLGSDFVNIARLLQLPQQNEQDQRYTVEAVKHWLEEHTAWLLIFDNVEDLATVNDFIPPASKGHILLTTRTQAVGTIAQRVDLDKMEPDEATLFLLRRTKVLERTARLEDASAADSIEARDIVRAMDGLPLALDQAGAYIEETACSLYDFFDNYRRQRSTLLDLRGYYDSEHPASVATTWLLSFEKVEQANAAAAELLRLCAFLHPDGILEEIITDGSPELGALLQPVAADRIKLDTAIAALLKFSLVRRNSSMKTLTIHRLVQAILKDSMNEATQRLWAERAVRAVNRTFPDGDQVATWQHCQRCLPHVHTCVALIEQWHMLLPEAARLLDQAGLYLLEHAQYNQARYLLSKALEIREAGLGPVHQDVAESLNNLAGLYLYQGMYTRAEPLLGRALAIREQVHGTEHSEVAICLNNLALLYNQQGRYALAEPLFQRALAIWEHQEGAINCAPTHPDVARTLNNLALLYQLQHKFEQAELYYRQGLAIWERVRGPEHPDVAVNLNNLAIVYQHLGKYALAEPLFQRVLAIREKTLGPEHPGVANSLTYLARLYQSQWKYAEAELLFKHALNIRKRALGPDHPEVAHSLNNLAKLYSTCGKYDQAEPLFRSALATLEQALGMEHPEVMEVLKPFAVLLSAMQRKEEAVKLAVRAKALRHG
ncbi:MAG: hypothetical protein NVSMB27_28310 [Ktedonobacteraceae bacterium]